MGMPYYSYSMDMWATGVTFADSLFRRKFFRGDHEDSATTLMDIAKVLGTRDLKAFILKYDIKLKRKFKGVIQHHHHKKPFTDFITNENKKFVTDDALDLLSKMLVIDHDDRITAREAMDHPYFNPVKNWKSQHEEL